MNKVQNKNVKFQHTAKDSDGNPVSLIGYVFSVEFDKSLFNINEVDMALKANNLDSEKVIGKKLENNKKNSFRNALNEQKRKRKGSDRVINFVAHDKEKGTISFQLDQKFVQEHNRQVQDQNGISYNETVQQAGFVTETVIVYDEGTDRVICDDNVLLEKVYQLLNLYKVSYMKKQLQLKIKKFLEDNTNQVSLRKHGGAYFVPVMYKDTLMNLINFCVDIDPNMNLTLIEVPKIQGSIRTVKESAEESMEKIGNDLVEKMRYLVAMKDKLSNKDKEKQVTELNKLKEMYQDYRLIVNSDLKKADSAIEKAGEFIDNWDNHNKIEMMDELIMEKHQGFSLEALSFMDEMNKEELLKIKK